MVGPFRHLGNASLSFGPGRLKDVTGLLSPASEVLILTGGHFLSSSAWKTLETDLIAAGHSCLRETVSGEPSPEIVDGLTALARREKVGAVVAVGGGSVLDAGKAVAAMLKHEGSVFDYLEGVGSREPRGRTAPMIAVPTTAGTGSEATKNAVISRRGTDGFKKSLRHDSYIPAAAVIDPELAVGCPPGVSLACGMDAFCQLLESYISTGATPFTDLLAKDGLIRFSRGSRLFSERSYGTAEEVHLRGELALAAYESGLTLANAGLGTVHGLAGPLGAFCDVPHGTACGLLVGPVFRNIAARLENEGDSTGTLDRLAFAGAALAGTGGTAPRSDDVKRLLDLLDSWSSDLPRLRSFGLAESDLDVVVAASGNKNSPVLLDEAERRSLLAAIL